MPIGRPPPGGAKIQFFRINPIQLAVPQGGRSIVGQLRHVLRSQVERVKVVLATKSDARAVGRELRIAFFYGGGGKLVPFARIEVKQEQVALGGDQQLLAIARPLH
jgi:hypothetical protein